MKNIKFYRNNKSLKYIFNILFQILYLELFYRKIILLTIDILVLFLSLLIIDFSLDYNLELLKDLLFYLIPLGIVFYSITGQYKSITRYISTANIYTILIRNFLLLIVFFIFNKIFNLSNLLSFKILFLLWIIINFFIVSSRLYIKDFI